ncbi:hypothetical protein BB560_001610 [Smittium megazygosporum]|uniref:Pyridoxal kinase n=1 Tax=Smittium megazygosporum TaxID=133381 RepID=A0A2T9ZH33_9FUNG|nr:hypothetical protein BB560_001610 [Smittium megazygosporum]
MHMFVSAMKKTTGTKEAFKIPFPVLNGYFAGAGDLLNALILAFTDKVSKKYSRDPLCMDLDHIKEVLGSALALEYNFLSATLDHYQSTGKKIPLDVADFEPENPVENFELQIVQNRKLLDKDFHPFLSEEIIVWS